MKYKFIFHSVGIIFKQMQAFQEVLTSKNLNKRSHKSLKSHEEIQSDNLENIENLLFFTMLWSYGSAQ